MTLQDGTADGDDPGSTVLISEEAIVNLLEDRKLLDNDEVRCVVDHNVTIRGCVVNESTSTWFNSSPTNCRLRFYLKYPRAPCVKSNVGIAVCHG